MSAIPAVCEAATVYVEKVTANTIVQHINTKVLPIFYLI